MFPISNADEDFGRFLESRFDDCVGTDAGMVWGFFTLALSLSLGLFPSLLTTWHFVPLGVQPLLENGDGDSWLLLPTTSNEGTSLWAEDEDMDDTLDEADKLDEDVDIDNAIEDAT